MFFCFVFNAERQQPAAQQAASWDHDEHSSEHYGQAEFYDEQACGATKGADMNKSTSVNAGRKGSYGVFVWFGLVLPTYFHLRVF